jgi:hypothetical protein
VRRPATGACGTRRRLTDEEAMADLAGLRDDDEHDQERSDSTLL